MNKEKNDAKKKYSKDVDGLNSVAPNGMKKSTFATP